MARQQFRKGFVQKSKAGSYRIYTIKVGTEKVAIKEGLPQKEEPKAKTKLEVKEVK